MDTETPAGGGRQARAAREAITRDVFLFLCLSRTPWTSTPDTIPASGHSRTCRRACTADRMIRVESVSVAGNMSVCGVVGKC